jgi:RHS repeat-associated protein
MVFDAFDRVREVDAPGHGLIRHRYDASGERATTLSPGPAGGLVERFFGGGLTQRDGRLELHVGLGGARVVARLNVPELPDGTAALGANLGGAPVIVYLHQGVGHGPTVMTDGAGALLEERHHEPYGTPLWVDADYELERLGWNGKPVDPLTGWSDHGARWHGTRFARWLSVDPPLKAPGGLVEHGLAATPYGFVAGNPVLFWDPDGRDPAIARLMQSQLGNWRPVLRPATSEEILAVANHRLMKAINEAIDSVPTTTFSDSKGNHFSVPEHLVDWASNKIERRHYDDEWNEVRKSPGALLAAGGAAIVSGGDPETMLAASVVGAALVGTSKGAPKSGARFVTSRAARREAMRQGGIPVGRSVPVSKTNNESGREYTYVVPAPGGGTRKMSVQDQTLDRTHPGQGHWEAGPVKIDPRTGKPLLNKYGRPALTNEKSKVDYDTE